MPEVKLSTTTNTPAWGKTLIESLTTLVSDIGSQIDLVNSNINSKHIYKYKTYMKKHFKMICKIQNKGKNES